MLSADTSLPPNRGYTLDINSYIALGSLVNHVPSEQHAAEAPCHDLGVEVTGLEAAGWIRTQSISDRRLLDGQQYTILRVYVLPQDVARRYIDRQVNHLKADLLKLIRRLDTNPQTWNGTYDPAHHQLIDLWAHGVDESLFYMFNMLESPQPSVDHFQKIEHKYIRESMEDILDAHWNTGLQSTLYPYQRRSAALMLEREERPTLQLDPKIEQRTGPDSKAYYYNSRDVLFYKEPLFYESCRGGVLAETMGLGKTLICLSLILATRHHLPKIPSEYNQPEPSRTLKRTLKTLQQMAISAVQRSSLPWQVELSRLEHHTGEHVSNVRKMLTESPSSYTVPVLPTRWNRNTILPPPKRLTLAATTVIVVPRNLCKQWQLEIEKHVLPGALSVLVMEDSHKQLPAAHKLRGFDIVLFTRSRFEMEIRDGADEQGRRLPPAHTPLVCRCPYVGATRERDCRCLQPDDVYDSPLKHLHFKRLIVDEGHSFSASSTKAVTVANKLVIADHRWVITGTPAKDMIGVELDLVMDHCSPLAHSPKKESLLSSRRTFNSRSDEVDAMKSLGSLASHFLQVRPWFAGDSGEPAAVWDEHVYRHEDLRKRTYSCYSSSLKRTLTAMVIKTRPEDVERDILLPPLVHRVVTLEPSFFDKATANLFSLVLIANAVTSERVDQDYIFHKNNSKARTQLIANLRQSSFFWSGFSESDIEATIKTSTAYLDKDDISCCEEDRRLMMSAMDSTRRLLDSRAWKMLAQTHELGLLVCDWPQDSAEFWSFDQTPELVLTGMTQLLDAQRHVDEQINSDDIGNGLAGAGIRSLSLALSVMNSVSREEKPTIARGVLPSSSFSEDPVLKRRSYSIRQSKTPARQHSFATTSLDIPHDNDGSKEAAALSPSTSSSTHPRKRTYSELDSLSHDSAFGRARIVGTTSSKLTYLIERILEHCQHEKILVFYDGDHIAYYIAQALELLHIRHKIYAKSLAASLKSEYVVQFDHGTEDRVLLMDVKQAAYGLNLSSASRIYFVNPVCRPDIEAQAIKRAHRIGQTRQVHVETLILRNTLEEKMYERAQRMTRLEHLDAKILEDDHGMKSILQHAEVIAYDDAELNLTNQMAPLKTPQQLWGRPGWQDALESAHQMQRKRPRTSTKRSQSKIVQEQPGERLAKIAAEEESLVKFSE